MMKRTVSLLALGLLVLASSADDAVAQRRLSLEGRLGVALPSGDLSDGGADPGLALAGELMYTFTPTLTGYAGLSRDDMDEATSTGGQLGLKFLLRRTGTALPWIRGGLLLHKMDIGRFDSDLGLGLDAGFGVDFDVSHRVAIVPAARLRLYSPEFDGFDSDLSATYFILDLGIHFHP